MTLRRASTLRPSGSRAAKRVIGKDLTDPLGAQSLSGPSPLSRGLRLVLGLLIGQLSGAKEICQSYPLPLVGRFVSAEFVEVPSREKLIECSFSYKLESCEKEEK